MTPRTVYPFAHVQAVGPLAGTIWMFEVEYKPVRGTLWPFYRVRADTDATWRTADTPVDEPTAPTMPMPQLQAYVIHEWETRHS